MKAASISDSDRFFKRLRTRQERKKRFVISLASILLILALLITCYMVASDYSYKAIAGKYELRMNGETSTLNLKEDRTFQQTLDEHGIHKSSSGTWRRLGEGGVVFSSTFLNTPGQEAMENGEVYADVEKAYGLFITIHINHNSNEPVYQKHFLN